MSNKTIDFDKTVYGFNGDGYTTGDRVEIHPGTDQWMMGARFGVVTAIRDVPVVAHGHRVHVRLDKIPKRTFSGTPDTFNPI